VSARSRGSDKCIIGVLWESNFVLVVLQWGHFGAGLKTVLTDFHGGNCNIRAFSEHDIRGDSGSANSEPRTVNLWLIVAEANAGHRCCNITDRGPQKRLNYNDKGLKLRDARLTKQYLLLFVSHCHSNDIQQLSPSVTPTPFPSTRASQNGPSGAT
jgi:hypothetical protein